MFDVSFKNKRVLITGHTGFKGAWLTRWLLHLGAKVAGYSRPSDAGPATVDLPLGVQSLFDELQLASQIEHHEGDICELDDLAALVDDFRPEYVFHLAAQSLVRLSYRFPVDTFRSNLLGTVNVLESLRRANRSIVAVIVTSDKCYENQETSTGYVEEDRLGGCDPYSSSKSMCELAVSSYRQSFFTSQSIHVATARAGNVIGGGDWSIDRIVPDAIRALRQCEPIVVRNATAIRPWQHVLEPLAGYLQLAAKIKREPAVFCEPFNFGPSLEAARTVSDLVGEIVQVWPGSSVEQVRSGDALGNGGQTACDQVVRLEPRETQRLMLNTDKAKRRLGWCGRWDFQRTVTETIDWYQRHLAGENAEQLTLAQIARYSATPMRLP